VRRLEPWGVISRRRHWYVAGFDRDRQAERVFRLSRITSVVTLDGPAGAYEIPSGIELRKAVTEFDQPEPTRTARVRLAAGAGTRLRRRGTVAPADDGDVVTVAYAGDEQLAEELLSYGPDAVVLEPPSLRDTVIAMLEELAR